MYSVCYVPNQHTSLNTQFSHEKSVILSAKHGITIQKWMETLEVWLIIRSFGVIVWASGVG